MTRVIRTILYLVSSKQGREALTKTIAITLCAFFIPVIIITGFMYSFFTFYGGIGGSDDVFSQAVSEIKAELKIENDLQPAILRAVYSKKYGGLDADKDDVKNTITTYFIKSEEKEHTVKQEDIEGLREQIAQIQEQINVLNSSSNKDEVLLSQLTENLTELTAQADELQKQFDSEQELTYRFLEMQEIKDVLSKPPFSFEASYITELENYVLYISNNSNIDFSQISFENETANDTQKKIVAVALSAADYGINATEGGCQKWVADIYLEVLGTRGHAASAVDAGRRWSVSTDWSKIQIGATVYGTASQQYGHCGIYIGNGMVIHNLDGYVKKQSLESWVKQYNGKCWGWENGKNLTGDAVYNCVGGMI